LLVTFTASHLSRVAVGLINLSGTARGYSVSKPTEMLDTTVLTSTAKQSIPGQNSGTFSLDMLLDADPTANAQFDVLIDWSASTSPYPITLAPVGFSTGSLAILINGLQTDLTTQAAVGAVVTASASGQGTGTTDYGVMLEDFTAVTIDGNGTARDNGAATANGLVAHLHVSAFSGLTNNVVTIEHSVDGSTSWATLVTFATYTGVTSERVEIAAGTTVRRYLRVVDNVTGAGSTTRAVAVARR
jgi:hypothetical protein